MTTKYLQVIDKSECQEVIAFKLSFLDCAAGVSSNKNYYFYSDPFPTYGRTQFRIKAIYEAKAWKTYITCWKPTAKITWPVSFNVTGVQANRNNISFEVCNVYYNDWVCLSNDRASLDIKVTKIVVPEVPTPPVSFLGELALRQDHRLVKLICKDGEVEILRIALENSSPVFSIMFEGTWKEAGENAVKLIDLDLEALQELKKYLYNLERPVTRCAKLFELAIVHEMEHLKECCAEVLYKTLTSENYMDVMTIAATYQYEPLVRAVILFMDELKHTRSNLSS